MKYNKSKIGYRSEGYNTEPKLYLYLFSLCYLFGYYSPKLAPILSVVLLIWSYHLIFIKKITSPIVLLILNARSIVGFSSDGNLTVYSLINAIVNYVPFFLLVIFSRNKNKTNEHFPWYTLIYIFALIFYLIIGLPDSLSVIGIRVIPMLMILSFMLRSDFTLNLHAIVISMRLVLIASLITLIDPSYVEKSVDMLQSGLIFGVASDYIPLLAFAPRAMGPFWDPRILGIVCAIYIVIIMNLNYSNSMRVGDVMLALAVVFATLSRGAIGTALFILAFTVVADKIRSLKLYFVLLWLAVVILIFLSLYGILGDQLEAVFFANNQNPFEQRADFSNVAFSAFKDNPLGVGLGAMRNMNITVGDALFNSVTDAFLMILLAEMGVFGLIAFLTSFFEISFGKNTPTKLLSAGLLIQMIGTDIPDFGVLYFGLIALIISAGRINNKIHITAQNKSDHNAKKNIC